MVSSTEQVTAASGRWSVSTHEQLPVSGGWQAHVASRGRADAGARGTQRGSTP